METVHKASIATFERGRDNALFRRAKLHRAVFRQSRFACRLHWLGLSQFSAAVDRFPESEQTAIGGGCVANLAALATQITQRHWTVANSTDNSRPIKPPHSNCFERESAAADYDAVFIANIDITISNVICINTHIKSVKIKLTPV
jgi:hypothetical protein